MSSDFKRESSILGSVLNGGTGRFMSKGDTISELSPAEKLQLVEDLWDDLAADPAAVPVHAWQTEELARRKANLMKNPASAVSWQQAMRTVRGNHGV